MSEHDYETAAHQEAYHESHDAMAELYTDVWWCYYCGCSGGGLTHIGNPLCLAQRKICCYEESMETADNCGDEGCCHVVTHCHGVSKFCCIFSARAFPPGSRSGLPICALCNKKCGGDAENPENPDPMVEEAFLCYYCVCGGCGCIHPCDPCIYGDSKVPYIPFCCCGVHTHIRSSAACNDGDTGCCYVHQKQACCISAGTCPPGGGGHNGIPILACCGKVCKTNDKEEPESSDDEASAPEQESMVDG